MKKYLKLIREAMQGIGKIYIFHIFVLLVSVFFMVLSSFISKILIDTIKGDIFDAPKAGSLELFVATVFGGPQFLSENLWVFAIIIITIAIAVSLLAFSRFLIRSYIGPGVARNMQLKLFYHIERLPYTFMKKSRSGDVIQTCTRDEEVFRRFLTGDTYSILYTFFIVAFSFVILFSINWKITLVSMILLPFLFIYSFFVIKEVRVRYRRTDDSEGLMTSKIEENLASVRVVKAYNNEAYEIASFEENLSDYRKKFIHWRKLSAFFFSSSDIFVFGQILLTTLYGIYLAYTGEITVGTLVVSFTFVNMMVWPIRDVATILSNMARAVASMDRLMIILNEPVEDIATGVTPKINGEITFENVAFQFDDADKPVLHDVNLKIKKGATVAVLGKTGAGKSTLAYLLTRLYDPTSGRILIDGTDITYIARSHIRQNVATVLQEPFLFSKTILSNIRIANPNASEEEVYKAARIADIHDSILTFKQGYETPVGEKGVTLSGGQRQRLAIARTIINKAPILIFDDSLSAVDTETDINIRTALKKRSEETTTFIITHRIATAKDADFIIVLEDGTISEQGTHDELIKKKGLYQRVYEIQTKIG
ncbi:MAG: ABC transporter ATP-binding protein [Bacilli bacterium]|jgi:ATP-binding cassette subfamily B protein